MARQGGALLGRNDRAFVVVTVVAATLMVVMGSTAYGQQCNLETLLPCLKTVKGPYPPQPEQPCCGAVMNYNAACMCSQFVDSKNYPLSYIKNVLAIPKACGRHELSGTHCGIYTIE